MDLKKALNQKTYQSLISDSENRIFPRKTIRVTFRSFRDHL